MYLVPLWALFSELTCRMGCVPLSSKLLPSGLSLALPLSSSRWRRRVTWICTPTFGPVPWRRYWIVPSHQIESPMCLLRKGCWTLVPFCNCAYASGWGGACGGRKDD